MNSEFPSDSVADASGSQHGLSAGHFHGGFRMLVIAVLGR